MKKIPVYNINKKQQQEIQENMCKKHTKYNISHTVDVKIDMLKSSRMMMEGMLECCNAVSVPELIRIFNQI